MEPGVELELGGVEEQEQLVDAARLLEQTQDALVHRVTRRLPLPSPWGEPHPGGSRREDRPDLLPGRGSHLGSPRQLEERDRSDLAPIDLLQICIPAGDSKFAVPPRAELDPGLPDLELQGVA